MRIAIFPLWWSVTASASAADNMIFLNATYSMRMGSLFRGDGMMLEDVAFDLR